MKKFDKIKAALQGLLVQESKLNVIIHFLVDEQLERIKNTLSSLGFEYVVLDGMRQVSVIKRGRV